MFRLIFRRVRNLAGNLVLAALAAASLFSAGSARADFPDRPITLIVPWAAGGGTDAVARQMANMRPRLWPASFETPASRGLLRMRIEQL